MNKAQVHHSLGSGQTPWIPFPTLLDEEAPTACSPFERKYFELCPVHLRRAGGLRAFIAELLIDGPVEDKTNKIHESPTRNLLTFMYLYLYFSSSSPLSNHEAQELERIVTFASKQIESCLILSGGLGCKAIHSTPEFMLMNFLLELIERVRTSSRSNLTINQSELEFIRAICETDFIFTYQDEEIALCTGNATHSTST